MKKIIILLAILLLTIAGCQYVPTVGNETNMTNQSDSNVTFLPSENTTEDVDQPATVEEDETTTTPNTSNLPTKVVKEGELVEFKKDVAFDPDGDELQYTFVSPLDSEGTWQTQLGDAGEYIVPVTVSDGELESTIQVRLIVEAINNRPVISGLSDITVKEGETIELDVETSDADGDTVTVAFSGFMTSNTKETNFNDAGTHTVTVTANDGKQTSSQTITVTVENVNRAPTLAGLADISVIEGEIVSLSATANDPDGDAVSITYSQPLGEDGSWETEEGDKGTYSVDITASDGEDSVVETITIVVGTLNNAPSLSIADTITVKEGETIELNPEVSDADGDDLTISYSGYMTTSSKETGYDDAGEYSVTISVTDGEDTVSKEVTIVVENTNRPPQFNDGDLFE